MTLRIYKLVFLFATLLGVFASGGRLYSQEQTRLEVIGAESVYPGDVVELNLELRMPRYSRWELSPPVHPALRLLSLQAYPISSIDSGVYLASWTLSYQAIESGVGSLGSGLLKPKASDSQRTLEIEAFSLAVLAFEGLVDEDHLEAMPSAAVVRDDKGRIMLIVSFALAVLIFGSYLWWRVSRRRNSNAKRGGSENASLESALAEILAVGSVSREQGQYLIYEYGSSLSDLTMRELERIVYSKDSDSSAVLARLKEELAR